jgi:cyclic dehypoxanthinyl futalosine synthase
MIEIHKPVPDELGNIVLKALEMQFLEKEEAMLLYQELPLPELMALANTIRIKIHPEPVVTWLIDRNVNITNVCVSACQFCNYYRPVRSHEAYITSIEEYKQKIEEMWKLGGRQLLLQGGLHPKLGLDFYSGLFSELKGLYPGLKLHALGPAEIVHIAKLEKCSFREVLEHLTKAGLDSLPGAGAEILADRVRQKVSKNKCTASEWLDVMRVAHQMDILTSATMMFGHIETLEERFDHILAIRQVQSEKPEHATGFLSFIPWPFQDDNTFLKRHYNITNQVTGEEYIRTIAIARILLPNIRNIQASWLTVGKPVAQICLHSGANDFGSIMIEENVVSVAGATHKFDAEGIQLAIREAGFRPRQRDQRFEAVTS